MTFIWAHAETVERANRTIAKQDCLRKFISSLSTRMNLFWTAAVQQTKISQGINQIHSFRISSQRGHGAMEQRAEPKQSLVPAKSRHI